MRPEDEEAVGAYEKATSDLGEAFSVVELVGSSEEAVAAALELYLQHMDAADALKKKEMRSQQEFRARYFEPVGRLRGTFLKAARRDMGYSEAVNP